MKNTIQKLNIKEIKTQAKGILSQNKSTPILVVFLYLLMLLLLLPTIVGVIICFGALTFGLTVYFLDMSRGLKKDFDSLLDGFKYDFKTSFLLSFLMNIYLFLMFLLLIVPGVIFSYGFRFAFYIMRDEPDLKYNEILKKSMQMTRGRKFELFKLDLSLIGYYLLCIITLGVGMFFFLPYINYCNAKFYDKVKELYEKNDVTKEGIVAMDDRILVANEN